MDNEISGGTFQNAVQAGTVNGGINITNQHIGRPMASNYREAYEIFEFIRTRSSLTYFMARDTRAVRAVSVDIGRHVERLEQLEVDFRLFAPDGVNTLFQLCSIACQIISTSFKLIEQLNNEGRSTAEILAEIEERRNSLTHRIPEFAQRIPRE